MRRQPESARLIFFIVAAAHTRSQSLGKRQEIAGSLSFSSRSRAARILFHEIIQIPSKLDYFAEYGTQLFIGETPVGKWYRKDIILYL